MNVISNAEESVRTLICVIIRGTYKTGINQNRSKQKDIHSHFRAGEKNVLGRLLLMEFRIKKIHLSLLHK